MGPDGLATSASRRVNESVRGAPRFVLQSIEGDINKWDRGAAHHD